MRKRICFVILLIVILVATVSLPVFSAVPPGVNSGVNFFNLQETQYRVIYQQYAGQTLLANATFYPFMSRDLGGFDSYQISNNVLTIESGQQVVFNVRVDDSHNDIFGWLNDFDTYYISGAFQLVNLSNNRVTSFAADNIQISYYDDNDQNIVVNASGTDGFKKFDYNRISVIELRATYTGDAFTYHAVQLRALTMYQRTPIYEQSGNNLVQSFVPFNEEYFVYQDRYDDAYSRGFSLGYTEGHSVGYDSGYDDGYEEGTTLSDPVKNWGGFILTATSGFLSFEIFPGFPLWALLSALVAIPLAVALLKIFAGG